MTKYAVLGLLSLKLVFAPISAKETVVRNNFCQKPSPEASVLHNEDFSWHQTLPEIKERAERLYVSDKRLEKRAYLNETGQLVLPFENFTGGKKEIRLTNQFIKSIRAHIEEALKRKYVDAIIFSDMGHSHFFIPKNYYDSVLKPLPSEKMHLIYENMFSHDELKILYHTAEQLKMKNDAGELIDDRHLQWRFFTRNLVGDNKAEGRLELLHQEDHSYNTARDYDEGYHYWGAGFYLSANINGCFPFEHNGKTYYFDINLEGFNPESSTGGPYF